MGHFAEVAKQINDTSTAHGFWPLGGRNFGEMLMLAVSELAEALEEHRDGSPARYYRCKTCGETRDVMLPTGANHVVPREGIWGRILDRCGGRYVTCDEREGGFKPEGTAVELADTIIRCLDTMHSLGVDIDDVIEEKMAYNAGRPYKHGRAY